MDRILVVDDSPVVRQRLAAWISSETTAVTHGDERVQPGHFDPELLDLLLVHGDRLAELYRHADTTGPIVEPSEP